MCSSKCQKVGVNRFASQKSFHQHGSKVAGKILMRGDTVRARVINSRYECNCHHSGRGVHAANYSRRLSFAVFFHRRWNSEAIRCLAVSKPEDVKAFLECANCPIYVQVKEDVVIGSQKSLNTSESLIHKALKQRSLHTSRCTCIIHQPSI